MAGGSAACNSLNLSQNSSFCLSHPLHFFLLRSFSFKRNLPVSHSPFINRRQKKANKCRRRCRLHLLYSAPPFSISLSDSHSPSLSNSLSVSQSGCCFHSAVQNRASVALFWIPPLSFPFSIKRNRWWRCCATTGPPFSVSLFSLSISPSKNEPAVALQPPPVLPFSLCFSFEKRTSSGVTATAGPPILSLSPIFSSHLSLSPLSVNGGAASLLLLSFSLFLLLFSKTHISQALSLLLFLISQTHSFSALLYSRSLVSLSLSVPLVFSHSLSVYPYLVSN